MKSFRLIRVNELLKRIISEYLHRHFTSETVAVTITKVETEPNLRTARVYFSLYDNKERGPVLRFLRKIRPSVQWGVGKLVRLKYMPQLQFIWDPSLEKTHHTLTLLDEVQAELEQADEERTEEPAD